MPQPSAVINSGNRTVSFNGFGTLILPSGTFNNVALVSEMRTNSLGPNSYTYNWYDISNGKTLMYYHQNGNSITAIYNPENPVITGLSNIIPETVSLYPNPASDMFSIHGMPNGSVYNITDLTGKTMYHSIARNKNESIDISDLPAGIYFVRIFNQNGTTIRKLLIDKKAPF